MKNLSLVLAIGLGLTAAGVALAHPHEYRAGNDTRWPQCYFHPQTGEPIGIGTACFDAGEVSWGGSVAIVDERYGASVGGLYCQDLNDDSICGDDGTFAALEPSEPFCGSHSLIWHDLAHDVIVIVDGPLHGPSTRCAVLPTFGTHGHVDHT